MRINYAYLYQWFVSMICINNVQVIKDVSLQSSTSGQLLILRISTKRFESRSFTFSAPTAWNSLPKVLHDGSMSLLSFRSILKTHLFLSYSFTVAEKRVLLFAPAIVARYYKDYVQWFFSIMCINVISNDMYQ